MPQRDLVIDALKGFAILAIICSHITHFNPDITPYFYTAFLPIFFIISGCVDKGIPCWMQWKKKGKQLLIPYFTYSFAITISVIVAIPTANSIPLFRRIVGIFYSRFSMFPEKLSESNPQLLINTTPLWFLTCLFLAFGLYYIVLYQNSKRKQYIAIGIYLIISLALADLPILLPWSIDTAFVAAIFIFLGHQTRHYILSPFTALLIFSIALLLISFDPHQNFSIREYGQFGKASLLLYILIGFLYTIGLRGIFQSLGKIITPLAYLGTLTLRMMILHMPIHTLITTLSLLKGDIYKEARVIITLALTIILSIIIPFFTQRLSNKRGLEFMRYL
ncbi:MAG: acyltransferase family protein [Alloprevotella sp.]|nr:acyltransferase family protein [Bacteroidales bacterium]MDY3943607.1 acyltransferase family protein [Alloprevotella sp.]